MSATPWLTIIGLGEDGPDGLSPASQSALTRAEIIIGPPRHLSLLPEIKAEIVEWPVPFSAGIDLVMGYRGRSVVVLASGDPFWFGAGSVLARHLKPNEWHTLPGSSTFSLAASRMGWPLERTECFGLHAAPLSRLRACLSPGARLIILLRDGDAVSDLAQYFVAQGFGASSISVLEALGGPRETRTEMRADAMTGSFQHPVCAAIEIAGDGAVLTHASGRNDAWFDNDGQITKRPVRALTLSALAPQPFEHLWDIGGGSGSISIEWLLSHPSLQATCIEPRSDRASRISANADRLGVDHLRVVTGKAPDVLEGLEAPDVVFLGGGLSRDLLDWLEAHLQPGTRVVANAVTLETEALLLEAQARLGGELMRIDISQAAPLGPKRGWKASYPIVQWSVTL